MTFHDLQQRLLEDLRQRVRGGSVTERSLARVTGVSQPHMHNVLKGIRVLSVERADEILRNLDMDLLDLIELEEVINFHRR
jgi:transcriptional regulator with XRE-family HTH domain